ncbi:MAG: hypothetical protein C0483_09880 [Pirellula sp.]|nr:hypothetical protein [Pirellula sp.]
MNDSPDADNYNSDEHEAENSQLKPKVSEQLLLDAWPAAVGYLVPARVLCTSPGRAQLADFAARQYPTAEVVGSFLDLHMLQIAAGGEATERPTNLTLRCEPDFTLPNVDVVGLPLSSQGDGELTRDQLQQGFLALRDGGLLLAATDNPRDSWMAEVLQSFGGKVRRHALERGVVYAVHRTGPPPRVRDYRAEFAFRDRERLFTVESRPGVFSHRRIDPGARRLIDAMEIVDGDRVLDIGCGWGAVGLAATARGSKVLVEAIDSHARAVECSQANAERNGAAGRYAARLEAGGQSSAPGSFDVALGNPPYYANFRIAELFTAAAHSALRIGGKLWMVTKFAEWYLDNLPGRFDNVEAREVKGYVVVSARKRRS